MNNNPPESIKLLPCPFCGEGKAYNGWDVDVDEFVAGCGNLNCVALPSLSGQPSREKAAEAWNQQAKVEQLRKELLALCERLDNWWYEADPTDEVKRGDRHPWTKDARKAMNDENDLQIQD